MHGLMTRLLRAIAFVVVVGFSPWAGARPLPAAPPLPPPPPPGYHGERGDAPREVPPGKWGNLSPSEREAIRRLSQEQREELSRREAGRPGAPGTARLTVEERRRLRELIREEHQRREEDRERRARSGGGGRRP